MKKPRGKSNDRKENKEIGRKRKKPRFEIQSEIQELGDAITFLAEKPLKIIRRAIPRNKKILENGR